MEKESRINWFIIVVSKTSFTIAVFAFLLSIIDLGFLLEKDLDEFFLFTYNLGILICLISLTARLYWKKLRMHRKIVASDTFLSVFLAFVLIFNVVSLARNGTDSLHNTWTYIALFLVFIREIYNIHFRFKYKVVNPAQLFVGSFFIIILMGSLLLMLPNATRGEISYVDALFTATSAVCVTGLAVVDTGGVFTLIG